MTKNKSNTIIEATTYRDSLGTADASGERKWLFPKKPSGKFTKKRNIVAAILLIILFAIPFIKIDGNPLFMFNILNREFYIFSFYFAPTDFYLFAIGLVASVVFVVVFTVVYGRLFCGWICPQTIFQEFVFRKIEYWIEGDRNKQIRLEKQPWNAEKIRKKLLKWTLFVLVTVIMTHLLLSYIIGIEELKNRIIEGPSKNIELFLVLTIVSFLFYFVFAWFREQVCTLVCPYGRLQGVLVDKDTINVAYDFLRGEGEKGRAPWKNKEDRKAEGKGDCIDCNQCVVVCPTGIDIRNGGQLECVNCTACIDACDEVMIKVGLPTGLIRYASENMLRNKTNFKFTPRVIAYTVVLGILVSVLVTMLFIRSTVETKLLKMPGTEYVREGDHIVDSYQFLFINKTSNDKSLTIRVLEPRKAKIELIGYFGSTITVKANKSARGEAKIRILESDLNSAKIKLKVGVYDQTGELIGTSEPTFEGPLKIKF